MKIGVLALQGDFALHEQRLRELDAAPHQVKDTDGLRGIRGLVLPGGESTTLLKLLDDSLRSALVAAARDGLPLLSTCAGTILLAKEVAKPAQDSLDVLDITVERNAYGRQKNSFIEERLEWTPAGRTALAQHDEQDKPVEGVFIRAPRVTRWGKDVEVLLQLPQEPALLRQGSILAATFHPELSESAVVVHRLFLALARSC